MSKPKIKSLHVTGEGIALFFIDQNSNRYSVPQVKAQHEKDGLAGIGLTVAADRFINEFKFDAEAFSNRHS